MNWISATSVNCFQLGGSTFNLHFGSWLVFSTGWFNLHFAFWWVVPKCFGSTFISAHSFQQFALRLAAVAFPFSIACLFKAVQIIISA
jgi:hypothetical protein